MTVIRRIVANLPAPDPARAQAFYGELLGLSAVMDLGWIVTYANEAPSPVQVSLGSEGGSGTALPAISIEVDDVDEVYERATTAGFEIVYGPADEPWGVRRFYVRDPFGNVINILAHSTPS